MSKVKVFIGNLEDTIKELESFLNREDIRYSRITQSESAYSNEHGDYWNITYTVFYEEITPYIESVFK